MEISDQRLDGQAFVHVHNRGGYILCQEVDDCEKSTGIDTILTAYFSDVLFTEAQGNAKTTHHEHHRIVLAYKITHFVGFPVFPIFIHKL